MIFLKLSIQQEDRLDELLWTFFKCLLEQVAGPLDFAASVPFREFDKIDVP